MAKGVGFSGSRGGSQSARQTHQVHRAMLWGFHRHGWLFEHGDCVGWDEQAHVLARGNGAKIRGHPPTDERLRARCPCDAWMPPLPYLERNRKIVACTAMLVAAPGTMHEELRSGTWSTVRHARKIGRHVITCWPDGTTTQDNDGRTITL